MSDLGNKEIFAKNLKYYMKLNNKTRNDICLDVNLPLMAVKDFDGQDVEITFNDVSIEADKQFFGKYSLRN